MQQVSDIPDKVPSSKGCPEYISDPAFLIEEASLLGRSVVYALDGLKFEKNRFAGMSPKTKWIVLLSTDEDISNILEIFDLVQFDADIEIDEIIDTDLFAIETARNELENFTKDIFKKKIDFFQLLAAKYTAHLKTDLTRFQLATSDSNDSVSSNEKIIKSIRVPTEQIDQLMNLVSEMVTLQARLNLLSENIKDVELTAVTEKYASFSKQLRDNAYTISLVPFGVALTRYKRLVHDLSEQLGKKVDFITEGADTVLDKKIIEQLADPIMHILRNCIDHGIELPNKRLMDGKPEVGMLKMNIFHKSNNVHIQISDDGVGIDADKIRKIAIERGLLEPAQVLSQKELINLVFLPGFSSKDVVSNISGRGVGLDVVKKTLPTSVVLSTSILKLEKEQTFTIVLR
jgi:two-component system chemotaxis sensor kinase CheA